MNSKIPIFLFLLLLIGCVQTSKSSLSQHYLPQTRLHTQEPITVIAHRGASGYRPEHTLAAYELAIEMGADFIEPDLVSTKDGILIARHENEISMTTDAEEKFPNRKKTKKFGSHIVTGWFTEDFTIAEIKTLRAHERLSTRNQSFNGKYSVPTFAEILAFAQEQSQRRGRIIGVYPETKHPSYFASIGLSLEPLLANELKRIGWVKVKDPVIIQSFELNSLYQLRKLLDVRLVFLYDNMSTKPFEHGIPGQPEAKPPLSRLEEFNTLAQFVNGVGFSKAMIIPKPKESSNIVDLAHSAGLFVHVYTFRSDKPFLAQEYAQEPAKEYLSFFKLGIDGVFTDFTDHAIKARSIFEPK